MRQQTSVVYTTQFVVFVMAAKQTNTLILKKNNNKEKIKKRNSSVHNKGRKHEQRVRLSRVRARTGDGMEPGPTVKVQVVQFG